MSTHWTKFAITAVSTLTLAACHMQWVSPYSADLQKRATDMLSEVVTWEAHMRSVAGTVAADPRHPDVQAQLAKWQGEIEAMSEIEIGIDPGSTSCDAFLQSISKGVGQLELTLQKEVSILSSDMNSYTHCETLPSIFTKMMVQVSGGIKNKENKESVGIPKELNKGDDKVGVPIILEQQCKIPWLEDDYFTQMKEGKATAGSPLPARPQSNSATQRVPSTNEEADIKNRCLNALTQTPGTSHSTIVDSLITDLDAIIYREGRQAPVASK